MTRTIRHPPTQDTERKACCGSLGGPSSGHYRALKKAGLIGCFHGDGVSATKEAVRQRVRDQLKSLG